MLATMPVPKSKLTATANINKIVQGEALTLIVEVYDDATKQVLDFGDDGADLDEAVATFPATDADAPVSVSLTGGDIDTTDDPGRLAITLDADATALLNVGEAQSWELELTIGGTVRIVQLVEVLEVAASLF